MEDNSYMANKLSKRYRKEKYTYVYENNRIITTNTDTIQLYNTGKLPVTLSL